jgi:hypothetical protein
MEQGKRILVERAPTAFGDVSFSMSSDLNEKKAEADVTLPMRNPPEKVIIRFRLPDGWKVDSAEANGGRALKVDPDGETIDLSAMRGKTVVTAKISKK